MRRTSESVEQPNPNAYIGREYNASPLAKPSRFWGNPSRSAPWSLPCVVEATAQGLGLRFREGGVPIAIEPEQLQAGVFNDLQLTPVPTDSGQLESRTALTPPRPKPIGKR